MTFPKAASSTARNKPIFYSLVSMCRSFQWQECNSADALELNAAHDQELAQVLKLVEAAVARLDEDLAAVDGIVKCIVCIAVKSELLAERCQRMALELRPDTA